MDEMKTLTINGKTYKVEALENLSILLQPISRTVALGEVAIFSVVATGEGLTYQWQYLLPTNPVWRDTTMTGNKTATLEVEGKESRNGYRYRCIITDANGNTVTSDAVTLTVAAYSKLNGYRFTVAAGSKVNLLDFRNGADCLYGILSVHNGTHFNDLMMVLNVSGDNLSANNTTIAGDGTVSISWDSDYTGFYLNTPSTETYTCTFIPLI